MKYAHLLTIYHLATHTVDLIAISAINLNEQTLQTVFLTLQISLRQLQSSLNFETESQLLHKHQEILRPKIVSDFRPKVVIWEKHLVYAC